LLFASFYSQYGEKRQIFAGGEKFVQRYLARNIWRRDIWPKISDTLIFMKRKRARFWLKIGGKNVCVTVFLEKMYVSPFLF